MSKSNKLILGKCEYDPELRELSIEGQAPQVIGHVQAKLLQLLYSNPEQYFSNDDLQREVWDGRVIENTTIRTTVSYLRKALGESEDCKYIDSGRNKGYRFVADIEEITPQRQIKRLFPFAVIAGLAILLIYVVFQSSTPQVVPKIETTLVGQELEATVSGELMVFSHQAEGTDNWNLYSKQLGKERYFRLTEGAFDDNNAAFSEDGRQIAFKRDDGKKCQVITADFSQAKQKLINEKAVFECPKESNLASIGWKNSSNLYLSISKSMLGKFEVKQFNLESKNLSDITSPSDSGRGDYFISVNKAINKVVYLRNVIGNKTEIWLYDEVTKESRKVKSIPMILMSVGWINNNELVVRTGWRQLSRLNLNSGKLKTIIEIDDTVSYPFVINNRTVGYMKGTQSVRDIVQVDRNGKSKNVISSSFRDDHPVYAEKDGRIAFISNRTGKYQIWIQNQLGELTQVTKLTKNLRIWNLTISRDGQYIAFVVNAQLKIMRTDGTLLFESEKKHLNTNPVFSHNSKRIYFASNINGEWFIEYRNMNNLKAKTQLNKGYVIKPCIGEDCYYFIKYKESELFKSEGGNTHSTGVQLSNIQEPDQITIIDNLVYYLSIEEVNLELLVQNIETKEVSSVMTLSGTQFSIQEEPFRVYTTIARKPETLLQSIILAD